VGNTKESTKSDAPESQTQLEMMQKILKSIAVLQKGLNKTKAENMKLSALKNADPPTPAKSPNNLDIQDSSTEEALQKGQTHTPVLASGLLMLSQAKKVQPRRQHRLQKLMK